MKDSELDTKLTVFSKVLIFNRHLKPELTLKESRKKKEISRQRICVPVLRRLGIVSV